MDSPTSAPVSLLTRARYRWRPVSLILALLLATACGASSAESGPGRFHHPNAAAAQCEIRTDDDGDGEVDMLTVDHYDRHERVALEEIDQDMDGTPEMRSRFAYDGRGRLRRVESSADGVTQTRVLEYEGDELSREIWTDPEGRRHVRLYRRDGGARPEQPEGEEGESVTLTYDSAGRVTAEDHQQQHGAHTYSTFRYDEHGDRVGETVQQAGQPMACAVEFNHDADHRLTRRTHRLEGTAPVTTTYTWRPDGTLARSETRSGEVMQQRIDYGEGCRVREIPERH